MGQLYGRVRVGDTDMVRLGVGLPVVDIVRVLDTVGDVERLCVRLTEVEDVVVGDTDPVRLTVPDTDVVEETDRVCVLETVADQEYDARADADGLPVVVTLCVGERDCVVETVPVGLIVPLGVVVGERDTVGLIVPVGDIV